VPDPDQCPGADFPPPGHFLSEMSPEPTKAFAQFIRASIYAFRIRCTDPTLLPHKISFSTDCPLAPELLNLVHRLLFNDSFLHCKMFPL
jgi:hypothetical protein